MVVGRGEKIYLRLLLEPLLGGTSCWHDRPPERGKFEGEPLGACLESGERESIYTVVGKKCDGRERTETYFCLVRVSGTHLWWSASATRPDRGG